MVARVLGYLAAGATILGGLYVLIQYGGLIVSERYQREIQYFRSNLEKERDENTKLHKEIDTMRSQLDKAQEQIRLLQSSIQELEKDRNKLRQMVDERPPPLRVIIDDSEAPSKFVVQLKNPSQNTIRLIQNRAQSWMNGRPGTTNSNPQSFTLPPGITSTYFNFTVNGDLKPLQEGKEDYRAAFCLIYEIVSEIDRRRWLTEHWFQYRPDCPNDHCVTFWKQDDRILSKPSDNCNIERLIPPDWLDIKKKVK
jgi:hypothetical protein